MRALPIAAVLLAAASSVPAFARSEPLYAEPAAGPRMTVDNLKNRRRLLGTDWYCVRDILIDGAKVFGGNHCRVKHGEKKTLRLAPGRHEVVFDTISEWGADDDPDVPPIRLTARVDADGKDLAVLLRDANPPEVVALDASDAALLAPPAASTAAAPSPAVSTAAFAASADAPADPFKALERLKELYDKGVITGDEFKAKKAELLKAIR
jgi:Short C-terminal domain